MDGIVHDIQNGNIESFKMAYNLYHSKLYFYVLKHTHSAYLSEETVQLTFIKLWEKRATLSESFNLSEQLFRIAKSIMIDLLRKQQVHTKHIDLLAEEASNFQMETDFAKKDELSRIYESIEQMSPVRKAVFKLRHLHDLPNKEISTQLSISSKTVENHLMRGRRQLKNNLLLMLLANFLS